jgi:hypothetical protein
MKKILLLSFLVLIGVSHALSQATPEQPVYPKTVGYMSFILPLVTTSKTTTTNDFSGAFSIGFPVGINILYSDRFGYSFELSPTIKAQNGESKVSNLLIDPGLVFRMKHGFAIVGRLAFETEGRYGVTPLLTKVIDGGKDVNYFVSVSAPVRDGNSEPVSVGCSLQIGIIFK